MMPRMTSYRTVPVPTTGWQPHNYHGTPEHEARIAAHAARCQGAWLRRGRPFLSRLTVRPRPPRDPLTVHTLLADVASEHVMAVAARLFGYDNAEELRRRRHKDTTRLREQIALLLHRRGLSSPVVARLMGSPSHSTVLCAIKRAKRAA